MPSAPAAPVLQAYLLGVLDFEAALSLQRRLVYHVAGDRGTAALVLCDHALSWQGQVDQATGLRRSAGSLHDRVRIVYKWQKEWGRTR